MKPGQGLEQLLDITKATMTAECQRVGLIKTAEELSRYFFHGVSHYLGLDTHDVGGRNVKLAPGMVSQWSRPLCPRGKYRYSHRG